MAKCKVCGRLLKNPIYVAKEIGPICERKKKFVDDSLQDSSDHNVFSDFDGTEDFVCTRHPNGVVTNVKQVLKYHSPTGFEWGYGGSGPADLALNILLKFGCTKDQAMSLHQDFKWKFVATLPKEGGKISAETIKNFIDGAQNE